MVVKVVDGFENFLGVLVVRRGGTVGDVGWSVLWAWLFSL
jgi:hypothetical protein